MFALTNARLSSCLFRVLRVAVSLTIRLLDPLSTDVGLIVGLEDTALLDDYFSRFMRPDPQGGYPGSLVKTVSPPDWTQVGTQEVAK